MHNNRFPRPAMLAREPEHQTPTMLVTDLKYIEHQILMTPALKKAIDFLRRPDIYGLADGRADRRGKRVRSCFLMF